MSTILFVLGLPGSGKSTVSRYIVKFVKHKQRGQLILRINDFNILYEMFQADIHQKQFKPTKEYNGFDVVDLTVFDTVLKKIEMKALDFIHNEKKPGLIVIEFARNNYSRAIKQFTPDFLQNAYFLFLDAKIHICKQRIRDRVANPQTEDDHYVSDYIFQSYYDIYNGHHPLSSLKADYGIDGTKIRVIANNGQFEDIRKKIDEFVNFIFKQEGSNMVITSTNSKQT